MEQLQVCAESQSQLCWVNEHLHAAMAEYICFTYFSLLIQSAYAVLIHVVDAFQGAQPPKGYHEILCKD